MSFLTDGDRNIIPLALRKNQGFHMATRWYFRDWDPLWYQFLFHQAAQQNVTFIAGIAAGKTSVVAASYMIDCMTTPYFKALNTSVTAKQAELPFEMIQPWIEHNDRLEHWIEDISLRPYPTIKFVNGSEYVFRTAGKDARFIRGHEFDRINYDEAGLDFIGGAVKVLRGRLRGVRADGTKRMARMDVITSPTDAPWLRERFDWGWPENPAANVKDFLSIRASTYMNTKLDPHQIELMEAEYTDDMIDVELRGMFPEYGMSMFNKKHIHACVDQSLNDALTEALFPEDKTPPKKGYNYVEHPRYGITHFEMPSRPDGLYIMAADPGTDNPPRRNSAVVGVLDISKKPAPLVYFSWIDGNGSYNPFLQNFKYAMQKYRCVLKGMDTTSTQKAIDELAFENHGIDIDGINFARDKDALLNSLIYSVSNHEMSWPTIKGIIQQMSAYSRENESKLAQDIVMMLAMLAYLQRFQPDPDTHQYSKPKATRPNRSRRTSHRARRR